MRTALASPSVSSRHVVGGGALALFGALLVIANRWGAHLIESGQEIDVRVPPLYAVRDVNLGAGLAVALAVGSLLLVVVPRVAARASWSSTLAVAFGTSIAWTVALNATRGLGSLTEPLRSRHEYLVDVSASPMTFVRNFTDSYDSFATHTRGHPPGFVAFLSTMDRLGFGGAAWAAVLCIVGGATAVVAVLVTVRDVAGEHVARRALPFVALAPAVLWMGSSADAFFAGLGACAVAAMVRGITEHDRAGASLLGGVLLGCTMLCTYGAVLLVAIPAVLAVQRRRVAPLVLAGVAAAVVLLVAFAAGFDYLEGLRLTRAEYFDGVARTRPHAYTLLANLAALAVVIGPATVVGLTRLSGHLGLLVGGALLAVLLADVSGMSRLEVERIWLPFAVWMLPAAAMVAGGARMERRWLALQMGWALAIQTVVRTGW